MEKATRSITAAKDVLLDSKILKFYSYFEIDIYHHPKIFPRLVHRYWFTLINCKFDLK